MGDLDLKQIQLMVLKNRGLYKVCTATNIKMLTRNFPLQRDGDNHSLLLSMFVRHACALCLVFAVCIQTANGEDQKIRTIFDELAVVAGAWHRWEKRANPSNPASPAVVASPCVWYFFRVSETKIAMLSSSRNNGKIGDVALIELRNQTISMNYSRYDGNGILKADKVRRLNIDASTTNSFVWEGDDGSRSRFFIDGRPPQQMIRWQYWDVKTEIWVETGVPFRRDAPPEFNGNESSMTDKQ